MLTHKNKQVFAPVLLFNVPGCVDIMNNPQLTLAGALNTHAIRESEISGRT
jgi:hypothetical protein